jgi:hypothetical protein
VGRLSASTAINLFANKKVTASQDDGFVEGLKTSSWVCEKHETIEKVTGSQDDKKESGGER